MASETEKEPTTPILPFEFKFDLRMIGLRELRLVLDVIDVIARNQDSFGKWGKWISNQIAFRLKQEMRQVYEETTIFQDLGCLIEQYFEDKKHGA